MAGTIKYIDLAFLANFRPLFGQLQILVISGIQVVEKNLAKKANLATTKNKNHENYGQKVEVLIKDIFTFFINIQHFNNPLGLLGLLGQLSPQPPPLLQSLSFKFGLLSTKKLTP